MQRSSLTTAASAASIGLALARGPDGVRSSIASTAHSKPEGLGTRVARLVRSLIVAKRAQREEFRRREKARRFEAPESVKQSSRIGIGLGKRGVESGRKLVGGE